MNISKARLSVKVLATFQPTAPEALKEQDLGIENFSLDFEDLDLVHATRLSVTNFGTDGETILINGQTQSVTFGTGAAGTAVRGEGLDYDGVEIGATDFNLMVLRVISGPNTDDHIHLISTGQFDMRTNAGALALQSIKGETGIPYYGDWKIKGPTGVQESPWIIEVLVYGK